VIRRGVLGFLLYYLLVGGEEVVGWSREVTPLSTDVQDDLLAELDRLTFAVLGFSNVVFWTVVAVIFGGLVVLGFTGIFVGVVARKHP